jgi:hypothetical protein
VPPKGKTQSRLPLRERRRPRRQVGLPRARVYIGDRGDPFSVRAARERRARLVGMARRTCYRSPKPVPKVGVPGVATPISSFSSDFRASRSRHSSRPSVSRRCPVERPSGCFAGSLRGSSRLDPRALLDREGLANRRKWPICRSLSPLPDSNRGPPPYHGISAASGRNPRQRFSPISAVLAAVPIATGCHRLRPQGSIKAPSSESREPGAGLGAVSRKSRALRRDGVPSDHARPRRIGAAPLAVLDSGYGRCGPA